MTGADKQYLRDEITSHVQGNTEPVSISLALAGVVSDEAEKRLCDLVRLSVEKKLAKFANFKTASRYDILIYDESPLPAMDRGKIMSELNPWVRERKAETNELGQVSLIISLDIIFNLGEGPRILHASI